MHCSASWSLCAHALRSHSESTPFNHHVKSQSGWLHVDQLNIEVHLPSYSTLFRVRALYDLFAGARACGLMLHHKEVNTWSPASKTCAEFAWVSFAHAKRTAAAVGSHAAEPKESD